MAGLTAKQIVIVLLFAFTGWAACGATIGIGMAVTNLRTALIMHVIAAPIYFVLVSLIYFRKFNYTSPFTTAAILIAFVIVVDFFLVALAINRSLEMFRSLLGTWLPYILIFTATWMTGKLTAK